MARTASSTRRNQAARVPQANRVPAIPKSWTRSIPRRSPAYCVNIAATSHVSSWPFSRCCSAHPNGSVSRALRTVLHAMASGLFGLTSVILPVFLALVVFSLMRKTQNKDERLHMALGWFMILWSVCSICLTRRLPPTPRSSICLCCSGQAACLAMWLAVRWRGAFRELFHCDFRSRHPVFRCC